MLLQSTSPKTKASELHEDILRTLLYFDIFGHPLRLNEIHNFLPRNSVSIEELRSAFVKEPLQSHIEGKWEMYSLRDKSFDRFHDRLEKERRAIRMWRIAKLMTALIKHFPFVRGVFVSGELSKGVASKGSDIDFFVVTAEHRVWITRTLFTVFKKIILFNRRRFFCYNHIVSELHLRIDERNIYTATEIVTLRPIYNPALYARFLESNDWVRKFMPNFQLLTAPTTKLTYHRPLSERILESLLPDEFFDKLDHRLFKVWHRIWERRYGRLSSSKRRELFQCQIHVSTSYVRDFLEKITSEYNQRLQQYGLSVKGSS